MRSFLTGIGILVFGYLAGALGGYAAIQAFSSNTHDRDLEAGMTGAFFTGPLLAVAALGVWAVARALSKRSPAN